MNSNSAINAFRCKTTSNDLTIQVRQPMMQRAALRPQQVQLNLDRAGHTAAQPDKAGIQESRLSVLRKNSGNSGNWVSWNSGTVITSLAASNLSFATLHCKCKMTSSYSQKTIIKNCLSLHQTPGLVYCTLLHYYTNKNVLYAFDDTKQFGSGSMCCLSKLP